MSDRSDDSGSAVAEVPPRVEWIVTCQVCGQPQPADAPTFCPACGEPVLVWGWAP